MKVLKSVNLHLEYVPRCFRNQNAKKVEHKVTSKKQKQKKNKKKKNTDVQADTLGMKKWENGSLITIT